MNSYRPIGGAALAMLLTALPAHAQDVARTRPVDDTAAVQRYLADVAWLADDARGGRGLGTPGLAAAADWLERQFALIGLEPAAGHGSYRQSFHAVVGVERGPATRLSVGGEDVPDGDFVVPGFSASGAVTTPVVFAGWGVVSQENAIDDYAGIDAEGRIVLVRRYTPEDGAFADESLRRRLSDLRYKAFTARERGAVGLLIADLPPEGEEQVEAPLPSMRVDPQGGAGIPIAVIGRSLAQRILDGAAPVSLATEVIEQTREVDNIVGRIPAGERLTGAVVLGAHYDHLGFGGASSLAPESHEPHNGADDNASGTAALLEAARVLAARREELGRDVIFVAFTGEENGLLGSGHFTREPPPGAAPEGLVAMLNMDMVGRLRNGRLSVLGGESAEEWDRVIEPYCAALQLGCDLGGDGYGPSDQMSFYAAGVPVLHFFTGAHDDYHKPSDDTELINGPGGVRIANLVAEVAAELTTLESLTYVVAEAPAPLGDMRSYGASLGTIPDYTGSPDDRPGMRLAGVRPEGPADRAGLQRGDWIVELGGREIRDIYDLMYVLRESRPGEASTVVVERDGEWIERPVTFGESAGVR